MSATAVGVLFGALIYGACFLLALIGALKALRAFITWRDKRRKHRDAMAVANGANASDFEVWESECAHLQKLAKRVKR